MVKPKIPIASAVAKNVSGFLFNLLVRFIVRFQSEGWLEFKKSVQLELVIDPPELTLKCLTITNFFIGWLGE